MLQMIWGLYRDQQGHLLPGQPHHGRSGWPTRSTSRELRDHLDHARSLTVSKKEMIWLAGNSFYGRSHIFEPGFLSWLADYQPARLRPAR